MTESSAEPLVPGPPAIDLLAFHPVPEGEPPDRTGPRFSLVTLWHGDLLLMVHERSRRCWELPGGGIEPGESAREAAVRELREETGQIAEELRFVGYATVAIGPERRTVCSALYTGEVSSPRPFAPNEEVDRIRWWDRTEPLPGRVQPVDVHLASLTRPGDSG